MRFRITEKYCLNEDIESMKKFYPNITDDAFMSFVALDPTYKKGSTTAGKYARWILGMANKGNGKIENISHITDALRRFEDVKNDLVNKDVMKYKSVQELEDALNSPEAYEEKSHRQEVRGRQRARKEADIERDADVVYKDSKWTVYVPKTYAASCKLGQGSNWCTASTESDYYYNYYLSSYPDSKYYIIINNANPNEKYQLHFESGQFMDKDDKKIKGGISAFKAEEGLYKFLSTLQADIFLNKMNTFSNQMNISPDVEEYTVKVSHADLADALSSDNRNAIDPDTIAKVLDGYAWDLFYSPSVSDDDVRYAYDNLINAGNWQTIQNIGATEESIFDDKDDVYYAIARAIEDATIADEVNSIETAVEEDMSDALPKWVTVKDMGIGDANSEFTVNTKSLIDSVGDIVAQYDVDEAESLEEVLLTIIKEDTNGVYDRGYGGYDDGVFNEYLSDELSEIE